MRGKRTPYPYPYINEDAYKTGSITIYKGAAVGMTTCMDHRLIFTEEDLSIMKTMNTSPDDIKRRAIK